MEVQRGRADAGRLPAALVLLRAQCPARPFVWLVKNRRRLYVPPRRRSSYLPSARRRRVGWAGRQADAARVLCGLDDVGWAISRKHSDTCPAHVSNYLVFFCWTRLAEYIEKN